MRLLGFVFLGIAIGALIYGVAFAQEPKVVVVAAPVAAVPLASAHVSKSDVAALVDIVLHAPSKYIGLPSRSKQASATAFSTFDLGGSKRFGLLLHKDGSLEIGIHPLQYTPGGVKILIVRADGTLEQGSQAEFAQAFHDIKIVFEK